MAIYQLDDRIPEIDPTAWVADEAQVIGRVRLRANSSVWFNATLRGDNELIELGEGSNVQEAAVLHTDPGCPLVIGPNVVVGHQAMLHGCTIGEGSLIGIQAVILNRAKIGKGCLIGAGALIAEDKEIPDGSMVLGAPGRIVRQVTPEEAERFRLNAQNYARRAAFFRQHLKRIA
jgi:carbonic anhydrase/acetyltransferase-like protein (isoleucine patch superfamily)